jgi:AcrR family transcriptional regulator
MLNIIRTSTARPRGAQARRVWGDEVDNDKRVQQNPSRTRVTTRDKILAAAAAALVEEGVTGISTRRVADRAKVNQALVHYHFGSIENLMLEVLRGTSAEAMSIVQARYADSEDFVDLWLRDLDTIFDDEVMPGGLKAWLEIMALVVNDDSLMESYRKEFADPHYAIMKAAVSRSLSRDGEDHEAEAEGIASFALIVKAGLLFTSLLGRNPGESKALALAAQFMRLHVQSILTEDHAARHVGAQSAG